MPLWQLSTPVVQVEQSMPPNPQATSWSPAAQVFPLQQPAHVAWSQVHVPAEHFRPCPQSTQACPPVPQAPLASLTTQAPLVSQQPLGHVWALQAKQDWLTQASPLSQALQAAPPPPHASAPVPRWQR